MWHKAPSLSWEVLLLDNSMGLTVIPMLSLRKGSFRDAERPQSLSMFKTLQKSEHPSRFLWLQCSFAFFCITLPVSGTIFKLIWTVKYSYFSRQMNVFLDLFIFKGNPSLHENSRHRLPVAGMWRCARGKGHWPLLPAVPVRMGASRGGGRTGSV